MENRGGIDFKGLEKAGLISIRRHPVYPLSVLKYTREAMYTSDFKTNNAVLMCRGLVLDDEGKIVARGLKKFFNYEELTNEEVNSIMSGRCTVTEKVDGTCVLLTQYAGKQFFYTLGSFDSSQAQMANQLFLNLFPIQGLNTQKYTYMFEYIAPDDKKVVDYGVCYKLVFICRVDNETGKDMFYDELDDTDKSLLSHFDRVETFKEYSCLSAGVIKSFDWNNEEGFVVRGEDGRRMKIKFESYLKKFRAKYQYTINDAKDAWKTMPYTNREGYFRDKEWDEEMAIVVRKLFNTWDEEYNRILQEIISEYKENYHVGNKKIFAGKIKQNKYKSALFALWDGRWNVVREVIMKIVLSQWKGNLPTDNDDEN